MANLSAEIYAESEDKSLKALEMLELATRTHDLTCNCKKCTSYYELADTYLERAGHGRD